MSNNSAINLKDPQTRYRKLARNIGLTSWGPVAAGAGLEQWGQANLELIAVILWFIGIAMQLFAGYLHFIKMKKAQSTTEW